jgi:hypothetical protein
MARPGIHLEPPVQVVAGQLAGVADRIHGTAVVRLDGGVEDDEAHLRAPGEIA